MKLNQRGLSMIELLISLGMIGAVSMGALTLTDRFSFSASRNDARMGKVRLTNDIRAALMNSDTCLSTLIDRGFNASTASTPVRLRLPTGEMIGVSSDPATLSRLPAYGLDIKSLSLTNKTLIASLPAGENIYWAQVWLDSSPIGNDNRFQPSPVASLNFKVGAGGDIERCMLGDTALDAEMLACQRMGGVMATGRCQLRTTYSEVMCPDGQYLAGFDADGAKSCVTVPTPPPPPPTPLPVCRDTTVSHGAGQGSSPRVFGFYAEHVSCIGTFGGGGCAGGAYVGYRGWVYCPNCVQDVRVCQ